MDPTQLYQILAQQAAMGGAQPAPSQPPPQPPSSAPPSGGGGFLDGLGHILSHPLVQGALGAYLGAISSPRLGGMGGALGRGGLMGLDVMGRAQSEQDRNRIAQQQLPLLQARTQRAQAEIPEAQARTGYLQAQIPVEQAKAASLQPIGPKSAGMIAQQNPAFAALVPPDTLATMTWPEASKLYDDFQKRQQEQPKIEAEIGKATAETAKARAETGAVGSLEGLRGAETEAYRRGLSLMPASAPTMGGAPAASAPAAAPAPATGDPGEPTHEVDAIGPDGQPIKLHLVGGKWVPAT